MGWFNSSIFGGSTNSSTTSNDTNTNTDQRVYDQSGNSGVNNLGEGDVTINTFDGGALNLAALLGLGGIDAGVASMQAGLNAGLQFGMEGLEAGSSLAAQGLMAGSNLGVMGLATGAEIAGQGLANAQAAHAGSLSFAQSALGEISQANGDSLSVLAGLMAGVFDNSNTMARESMKYSAAASEQAVEGFANLSFKSAESSDDRVTRLAGYAFAAIAAIMILPIIFKKG